VSETLLIPTKLSGASPFGVCPEAGFNQTPKESPSVISILLRAQSSR
jgi:hypothetical protein